LTGGVVLLLAVCFLLNLALPTPDAFAQTQTGPSGEWTLTTTILGYNLGERLNLKLDKDQLSGSINRGEKVLLQGTLSGQDVRFNLKESGGTQNEYVGRLVGDTMSGEFIMVDTIGNKTTGQWSAHAFVSVPSGVMIGLVGGTLVMLAVVFFDQVKIDDPVGALSVHLVNGIGGTLALGLFL
jgi:hypothetical protein